MMMNPPQGIEIFYAYADQDESLRRELEKHLKPLKRQGLIVDWHKQKVPAGAEWAQEVDAHLSTSRIILLLVSSDFTDSDYCYNVEMTKALERHEAKQACVIPIILRPTDWEGEPYGKLQALPSDGIPVTDWPNRDRAFVNIVKGIKEAIKDLNVQASSNPISIDHTLALLNDFVDILTSQGRWSEVLNRVEEALQLAPNDVSWLTRQVQAFHQLGQNAQAQKVYEQVRTLYPHNENVHALAKTVIALSDPLQIVPDQPIEDLHTNSQQEEVVEEQEHQTPVQQNTQTRLKLRAAEKTDAGKQREQNEDFVYTRIETLAIGDRGLFIVADGMGGYQAGEVASKLAVETISRIMDSFFNPLADATTIQLNPPAIANIDATMDETIKILRKKIDVQEKAESQGRGQGEIDPAETLKKPQKAIKPQQQPTPTVSATAALPSINERLTEAIQEANHAILHYGEQQTSARGMSCTVTMAFIHNEQAYIANVGDSRTYLLRNGKLEALTRDHSLVARLVEAKQIKPGDVYSHPQRNLIYRSLGAGRQVVVVDVFPVTLSLNDRLLLCSKGLWWMVRHYDLLKELSEQSSPQQICDNLIDLANANGGEDNISAIVVFVE